MKRFTTLFAMALVFAVLVTPVHASHEQDILGASTQLSDITFPTVTSGPGHILPDSPLYALDKLYQKFRLALVFTPENKAQLHMAIAGERLAEVRVMSSRNNRFGVESALRELEAESLAAAESLKDAAAQGKNVSQLARTIHQSLSDYKVIVEDVKAQVPDTAYEHQLASVADTLWEAKIVSEEALPAEDLERELAVNIEEQLDAEVLGVASATERLQKKLTVYEKQASKAAEKELKKKQEEAARELTKEQSKAIKSQREKAIKEYLAKMEALRKQREKELTELKKTIKELNEQLRQLRSGKVSTSSGLPVN